MQFDFSPGICVILCLITLPGHVRQVLSFARPLLATLSDKLFGQFTHERAPSCHLLSGRDFRIVTVWAGVVMIAQ